MKFICDAMLGKLARYLRILGLDAEYVKDRQDLPRFIGLGESCLFTRNMSAMKGERTYYLKSDLVQDQLREIKEIILPFVDPAKVMNRCIECNKELVIVPRDTIEQRVPEYVFHTYQAFKQCPLCQKIYWGGTHTKGMEKVVEEIIGFCRGKEADGK